MEGVYTGIDDERQPEEAERQPEEAERQPEEAERQPEEDQRQPEEDQRQPEEADNVQLLPGHRNFRVVGNDPHRNGNSKLVKLVAILILLQLVTLVFVIAVVGISASNLLQTDEDATTTSTLTGTAGAEDRACNFSLFDSGYNNSMLQKDISTLNMALTLTGTAGAEDRACNFSLDSGYNNSMLQKDISTLNMALTFTGTAGAEDRACNFSLDSGYNDSMLQKDISTLNMALTQGQGGIAQVLNNTAAKLSETASKVDDIQEFAEGEAMKSMNQTNILNQVMQTTQSTSAKLTQVVSTLSSIKNTGTSTSSVVDDIIGVVRELLELQNASSIFNSISPVSCSDIKSVLPNAPSGWYHVNSRNIYCNMDELCGSGGGWTRIGYLDMSDSTQNCPGTLAQLTYSGVRYCRRAGNTLGSCSSTTFSPNGLYYTQICGRVTAYQYANTDAISPGVFGGHGINSWYVDGISITRGYPREHVWTLMAALYDNVLSSTNSCPCATGSTIVQPSFIGNNYYCESGNPNSWFEQGILYPNDALWDGQQCASLESPCCTNPNLPWFHKTLSSTNEYIEMRVCGDERPYNEDTPISFYEMYIK